MNADQWINEFTPSASNPEKTVLHASNVQAAPAAMPQYSPTRTAGGHESGRNYTLGAVCLAGLAGFIMGRAVAG